MPRGSKKTAAAKVPVALYWVSTADHDEDWFIFAKSARSAAKFHADHEGYGPRETAAEPILEAPETEGSIPTPRSNRRSGRARVRDFEGWRSRPQCEIWESHLRGGAFGIVDSGD